jgi:UDP-4-amino-4-deoxy-L-arabinose formyltransferase/UDP-glucuronic acid dehydrogenase (UDP-4-keto-hexauronic acid decarboxylating)
MRVAVLGRTRMLLDAARLLVARGHTVPIVATCKPVVEYGVGEADFDALARDLGARFLATETLDREDVVALLRDSESDVAVSVSWVNRIGAAAIGAFPFGILNVHGGDLPRYRGNAPFAWAILNGEDHVGITVHLMDADDIDSGPIVRKCIVPLSPETYIGELYARLEEVTPGLLAEAAEGLVSGAVVPTPQMGNILRGYPRRPEDGRIDWRRGASGIARLVRASAEPFAGAFCEHRGSRLVVWRAHEEPWTVESLAMPGQVVARRTVDGSVLVATGDGLLALEIVSLGAGDRVLPTEVIKSSRDRLA